MKSTIKTIIFLKVLSTALLLMTFAACYSGEIEPVLIIYVIHLVAKHSARGEAHENMEALRKELELRRSIGERTWVIEACLW